MQEQQSQFEAAVVFLDSVVTQVSAAHLADPKPGSATSDKAGILRELQALLQQVRYMFAMWVSGRLPPHVKKHRRAAAMLPYAVLCKASQLLCPPW